MSYPCEFNSQFKSISNITEDLLLNIIETNFKSFLDWSFLRIGGWMDVAQSNGSLYGGWPPYQLMSVEDPSYTDGQVWQAFKKDWVYEHWVTHNSLSPTRITAVYVNGSWIPYSLGDFVINYPLGRVIFNTPIATTSVVYLDYSYRTVQIYRANDAPWFQILQYMSYDTNNPDLQQISDGEWAIGGHHRVQMPCIIIESLSRSRSRPREIGSQGLILEQDVLFHIVSDNKNDRNKLLDILRLQQDLNHWLYNTNKLAEDDKYPLDYNGDLKANPLTYPQILEQYKWRKCWWKNVVLMEVASPHHRLHQGSVRATIEIIYE